MTVSEDQSSLRAYSYSVDFIHASARVEFDAEPVIEPMGNIRIRIRFFKKAAGISRQPFSVYFRSFSFIFYSSNTASRMISLTVGCGNIIFLISCTCIPFSIIRAAPYIISEE